MDSVQSLQEYKTWYDKREKESLEEFFTYLRFKSISAQSAFKQDLLDCAAFVEKHLENLGFTTVRWEGNGHPIVFGERIVDPSAPTLLFYGHYDVQPPEPFDLWDSKPFEPEVRDGRVYARGAEDNKGQNFYCLLALRAFFEKNPNAKLNVKYVLEGEEEMGSDLLHELAPSKAKELKADYLLVVDSGMGSMEKPGLEIGCRGISTMEIEVQNTDTDLHSGSYGGIAYNPNRALAEVLGKLIDEKGHINIPGFYDDIKPLSKEEIALVDTEMDEKAVVNEIGLRTFHTEEGYSVKEANFFRPTLEINGMWGGYTDEGFKTVIPKVAFAKISCRLVPDLDPKKIYDIVSKHIKAQFPEKMQVKTTYLGGGKAAWASPKGKATMIFKEAYESVFGSCGIIYGGGSIPITPILAEHSGAEFILPGVGLPCDRIHAPNESFGLDQLRQGFLIITKSLELFAQK